MTVKNPKEAAQLKALFEKAGFATHDLTDDVVAKEHIRHMVGGHARNAVNEVVYTFEFPEKPGALMNFLDAIADRWNISLFHYRNHGSDHGKVLAGFQVPVGERKDFESTLKRIGYQHTDVTQNAAYKYFLST